MGYIYCKMRAGYYHVVLDLEWDMTETEAENVRVMSF